MQSDLQHLVDFHFAERCLSGDSGAIAELHKMLMTAVVAFLVRSGTQPDEASEICEALLTDLVMPRGERKPRLTRYIGLSSLETWVKRVALNEWMDRKRKEQFEHSLMPTASIPHDAETDRDGEPEWAGDPDAGARAEAPLLALMIEAIESAFGSCTPEDFVLLQLSHCDDLHGTELAVMFRCHPAQITRRLATARKTIAESVMQHIRKTDPWLELQWEDFIELCRTSTPTCFGFD